MSVKNTFGKILLGETLVHKIPRILFQFTTVSVRLPKWFIVLRFTTNKHCNHAVVCFVNSYVADVCISKLAPEFTWKSRDKHG